MILRAATELWSMAKEQHPYFDAIFEELSTLGQITPKAMFGHPGYAIGTSIFAFLDGDALIVKTTRFQSPEASLPRSLRRFVIETIPSRTWIGILFDDSLDSLRKHWPLIEESYAMAVSRESEKIAKRKTLSPAARIGPRSSPDTSDRQTT